MVSIHVLYSIPGPGSSLSEVCFQQHLAAQHDQPGTVGLLLEKGAPLPPPIEATNMDNSTSLDLAAWDGHSYIVQLLKTEAAEFFVLFRQSQTKRICTIPG